MKYSKIHIVALDVPFPPDYGGIIDVYYRAKALKTLGIKIHLHCFEYGRGRNHDYSEIADEITYYDRKMSFWSVFSFQPFIVKTRKSEVLIQNLLKDNAPILLEGQHCAAPLEDKRLDNRIRVLRNHNIEWMYYKELAKATRNPLKRAFFHLEYLKLKKHDPVMKKADLLLCVNTEEVKYYRERGYKPYLWLSAFRFPIVVPDIQPGNYALYQGNLSVPENEQVALYFLHFWQNNQLETPLIIAGKNPTENLILACKGLDFVTLKSNLEAEEMERLIAEARFNLLFTFQATGLKLKLLLALQIGQSCLVNPQMIDGTDFKPFCTCIESEEELIRVLQTIPQQASLEKRIEFINQNLNPVENARRFLVELEKV